MKKHGPSFDVMGDGMTGRPAVIYCRVSDIKQTIRGDGLNSQETRCREYANGRGYTVIQVFKEPVSGKTDSRPEMRRLLNFLKERKGSGIVVIMDDINRLARGMKSHHAIRDAITDLGGSLEALNHIFAEDADSQLIENLLASVAQHGRQKNGEQTTNRMRARMMNGFWVFQPPVGYKYVRESGRGSVLKRDEPVASVVRDALEGYATGKYETQADVMRFLQDNPLFPKDASGTVRHQRVNVLLTQCLYAGYVERPNWNVSRRPGAHEGLISLETFQLIQDRLNGIGRAPHRKNLNADFSLRGFVECADCGTPLTACWSKGNTARHPYYLCHKRGCDSYGKSIRRDLIEGQFEELLKVVRPTPGLFNIATRMFREHWDHRIKQASAQADAIARELVKVEKEIEQLLDRVVAATVPSVITAYENRIRKVEEQKCLLKEKLGNCARPASSFDDALRTALEFLANPWNLWKSEHLEDRRTVLKLTFSQRLSYKCKKGFRTASLSMPFNVLADFFSGNSNMAHPTGFEPVTSAFGARNATLLHTALAFAKAR